MGGWWRRGETRRFGWPLPAALLLAAVLLALLILSRGRPPQPFPAPPALPIGPLRLQDYPRPADDNGRGVHWIPTTRQPSWVVRRYVGAADLLGMRWVVFLNSGAEIGDNDLLVRELVARGIEPVMRVLTHRGAPLTRDLTPMVQHYRQLGVSYFQLYNEPNLPSENQDRPPSVERYLDLWLPAAHQVVAGGGLPGLGALAPGAEVDDVQFLRETLQGIRARGETAVLDHAWIGVHNYLLAGAEVPVGRDPGFRRPELYDRLVRAELGRSLPLIGTEGGIPLDRPGAGSAAAAERVLAAFRLVEQQRPPYELAYSYWLIANEAGGGKDHAFREQALFRADGQSPLVDLLRGADDGP